jgi:hypothetical protein
LPVFLYENTFYINNFPVSFYKILK